LPAEREWLLGRLATRPDVTLRALVAELSERGVVTSYGSVWRIVREAGITSKKDADRPRAGSALDRQMSGAMAQVSGPDRSASPRLHRRKASVKPIIRGMIGSGAAKTNMTRLRGWSKRGSKLIAKAPFGQWKTLTFVAALRCDRIDAPCVLDGPINGQLFLANGDCQDFRVWAGG
jgi:hypothetical protein